MRARLHLFMPDAQYPDDGRSSGKQQDRMSWHVAANATSNVYPSMLSRKRTA
jgi:hypothetical protein